MHVLAFTKYGRKAASTRQRLLQFIPALATAGITTEWHALLGDEYVESLASNKNFSKVKVLRSYATRVTTLLREDRCDLIWIYAELFPYLPAVFERLAFWAGKPVIYDFDDAFFLNYEGYRLLSGKLEPLFSGAKVCTCGNDYLRQYASRFNRDAIVIPTVVDTDVYLPLSVRPQRPVTIGWIGSPSTWRYVQPLLPLLEQLARDRDVRVAIVGAGADIEARTSAGIDFIEWSETNEVHDIQAMDIGIMPLPDEPWARGKSGYKLIQYMACGLPVAASPVGVNSEIVLEGQTGFLAADDQGWARALQLLVDDQSLRAAMGASGRRRAATGYSLAVHAPRVVELFQRCAREVHTP